MTGFQPLTGEQILTAALDLVDEQVGKQLTREIAQATESRAMRERDQIEDCMVIDSAATAALFEQRKKNARVNLTQALVRLAQGTCPFCGLRHGCEGMQWNTGGQSCKGG